eukprot:Protomagalhaensia_sp_Gyna_25__4786@NODE_482_length_3306_cov_32_923477_g374_i0_p2_GENE_NODE_482_length_3306_cov_32_923477_g374_i0NODE_482_length_3306_cov_32_923477_g374_i0_p2_ORF_typecomplete_len420_score25_79_NODE_482_length_3306_cov_32_923477_g374_i013532612
MMKETNNEKMQPTSSGLEQTDSESGGDLPVFAASRSLHAPVRLSGALELPLTQPSCRNDDASSMGGSSQFSLAQFESARRSDRRSGSMLEMSSRTYPTTSTSPPVPLSRRSSRSRSLGRSGSYIAATRPPVGWAFGDGPLWGRLRRRLAIGSTKSFGCNPLHLAAIGVDLGIYGEVLVSDYLGENQNRITAARRPRLFSLSRLTLRFFGALLAIMLGLVAGFTVWRPTLILDGRVTAHGASTVRLGTSSLSASLGFELSMTNPSRLPLQLMIENSTTASDIPETDTKGVVALMVPPGAANSSLFQPLGFAAFGDLALSRIPFARDVRLPLRLTTRLNAGDPDGFAQHLTKPVTPDSIADLGLDGCTCSTILELYHALCQRGFILIEAAWMQLSYCDFAGTITIPLIRSNPFPVRCDLGD